MINISYNITYEAAKQVFKKVTMKGSKRVAMKGRHIVMARVKGRPRTKEGVL
jgi:hypothetical protein